MKPTTIRGAEYFPILSGTCSARAGDKKFYCAFYSRINGLKCTLTYHERSCANGPSENHVIFLSKEDQALAVMLGAEAPT